MQQPYSSSNADYSNGQFSNLNKPITSGTHQQRVSPNSPTWLNKGAQWQPKAQQFQPPQHQQRSTQNLESTYPSKVAPSSPPIPHQPKKAKKLQTPPPSPSLPSPISPTPSQSPLMPQQSKKKKKLQTPPPAPSTLPTLALPQKEQDRSTGFPPLQEPLQQVKQQSFIPASLNESSTINFQQNSAPAQKTPKREIATCFSSTEKMNEVLKIFKKPNKILEGFDWCGDKLYEVLKFVEFDNAEFNKIMVKCSLSLHAQVLNAFPDETAQKQAKSNNTPLQKILSRLESMLDARDIHELKAALKCRNFRVLNKDHSISESEDIQNFLDYSKRTIIVATKSPHYVCIVIRPKIFGEQQKDVIVFNDTGFQNSYVEDTFSVIGEKINKFLGPAFGGFSFIPFFSFYLFIISTIFNIQTL